ncbi:hypothetical protein [Pantoea agglomerans]|uniref:hypothetical protein n=1 Tax=Enterobacter agglomerans TaxID=549 RepID=UPI0010C1E0E6|nr:hypothetical protein [Pantoea agglomerans]TKK14482.1 hypothetical protein PagCFBP13516_21725 [Pantoea agglomerans]
MFNQFCKRLRDVLDIEQVWGDELVGLLGAEHPRLNGSEPIPMDITMRLLKHRRLQKYAMYLMTEQIAPVTGQISPDLAHYGQTVTTC